MQNLILLLLQSQSSLSLKNVFLRFRKLSVSRLNSFKSFFIFNITICLLRNLIKPQNIIFILHIKILIAQHYLISALRYLNRHARETIQDFWNHLDCSLWIVWHERFSKTLTVIYEKENAKDRIYSVHVECVNIFVLLHECREAISPV